MAKSTVILRWNPAFSSFGNESLVYSLREMAELESAIPDFNWRTGHSGELLTPLQSRTLKRLWKSFLTTNADYLSNNSFNRNACEVNAFGVGKNKEGIDG